MFKKPLFYIIVSLAILCNYQPAFSLSEYGLRCDDNPECVKCRDNIDCIKCLHKCWNAYGYADSDIKNTGAHNSEETCQLKRAKWCSAQCWDGDDTKKPDYVSTKPNCHSSSFYAPPGGVKFPDIRPNN